MTHEERMQRINELYRKSQAEGLTEEEKLEQQQLRQEYLGVFRENFRKQLESIEIVDVDGEGRIIHTGHSDCGCSACTSKRLVRKKDGNNRS
nr:DUF896 domain-containing protein [Syntrophobotulus glycolicus]